MTSKTSGERGFSYAIAKQIIHFRVPIILFALAATVVSVLMIGKTTLNYDLATYLSKDTLTAQSLKIMNEEFEPSSQLSVMLCDESDAAAARLCDEMARLSGVALAAYDGTKDVREQNGHTYRLITLSMVGVKDESALLSGLDALLDGTDAAIEGEMETNRAVRRSIADEIPAVMLIAVVIVLTVLFLTSHAWIEPLLFVCVLLVSIAVNMGTNWIFPSISFITYAVTAILQLALAMDYSIMLLTNYDHFLEKGHSEREAVTRALAHSFMPVSSSSRTTIAGLAALMFMSFTIGFDIGIVLSKGILLSMLTVFILMPALIFYFSKSLKKTRHKAIPMGGERLARLSWRLRKGMPIVMIAVILGAYILQTGNTYLFGMQSDDAGKIEVSDVFGGNSMVALLVPKAETSADYEKQLQVINDIRAIEKDGHSIVQSASAMPIQGEMAIKQYTAGEAAKLLNVAPLFVQMFYQSNNLPQTVSGKELLDLAQNLLPDNAQIKQLNELLKTAETTFNGDKHSRILLSLDLTGGADKVNPFVNQIEGILRAAYGDDIGMAGHAVLGRDISTAFGGDLLTVNLITILAVFLIVAISFRSLSVPLILVCVIQGAIWINMAISRLTGTPIFFMSYLICMAIQMGATIDYGILLASNYRISRAQHDQKAAIERAMRVSMPTILTSGVILIAAGYIISFTCSVFYISSIGHLLGRGTIISVFVVTVLLPQLLTLFDRFVMKTGKKVTSPSSSQQM